LTKEIGSYYIEYTGQVENALTGEHEDKYMYSYSDKTGKYNLVVQLAVKCYGAASCHIFPREYQSTMEDKTKEFGYDPNDYTFFVGQCKIQPK